MGYCLSLSRFEGSVSRIFEIALAFGWLDGLCEPADVAPCVLDGLWDMIGALLPAFTPKECANFFAAAGYEPS